jgi:hypothetical protein
MGCSMYLLFRVALGHARTVDMSTSAAGLRLIATQVRVLLTYNTAQAQALAILQ